ncbi:MAG: hypothetical protein A4E49_01050 [Methanosaeta sp. PtaU1.Bin112]|nr:MAG: hypothetical protein A4E49_01050 [Methanosaeta sp. PtaU1.Bin112]
MNRLQIKRAKNIYADSSIDLIMKSLMLLTLVLLLCSNGSLGLANNVTFDELMASALRSLVVDSSADLKSYSFDMEMSQEIDLVNLSTNETQKLCTRSLGYGMANMTQKALKLYMASLSHTLGDKDDTSAIAIEEYLINDTIYMKVDGNWTVIEMPGIADTWATQNAMTQQLDMFNQSRLTLIGSENVEGDDCYKVRAEINMEAMSDQLLEDVTSLLPMKSINYNEIFRNMTLDICYWITKDTHLLKKTEIIESFAVTPQSLGITGNQSEDMEMNIKSTVTMLFEGFNESVTVSLPSEATKAQPFPMGLIASEEVSTIRDDNETLINGTLKNDVIA